MLFYSNWEFVREQRTRMAFKGETLERVGVFVGDRTLWLCNWRAKDGQEASTARERAKLIAAAPQLYDALKWVEQSVTDRGEYLPCKVCGQHGRKHTKDCVVGYALSLVRQE